MAAERIDIERITSQLGRRPRGDVSVVVRCARRMPQVIRTEGPLDSGGPFPTLFWLTCPAFARDVARLEAGGATAEIQSRVDHDPGFRDELARATAEYVTSRDGEIAPGAAGVGGVADRSAVKCLHAHHAHYLATGDNPVGKAVAGRLPRLDPSSEPICENCGF